MHHAVILYAAEINSSDWTYCLYFVDFREVRCEFADSADSEAFLISDAFFPQVPLQLSVLYNISSPDTAVDVLIMREHDKDVLERYLLAQEQNYFSSQIPSTFGPMYVVLNAYRSISTASSPSSVTILRATLYPHSYS